MGAPELSYNLDMRRRYLEEEIDAVSKELEGLSGHILSETWDELRDTSKQLSALAIKVEMLGLELRDVAERRGF